MEDYSIEGIKDMMRVIVGAKQHNPKLHFLGIVPNRVDRRNPRQVKHLARYKPHTANFWHPLWCAAYQRCRGIGGRRTRLEKQKDDCARGRR